MKSENILIIEDDEEIRVAIQDVLKDEGYKVKLVNHGKEALEYLNSAEKLPCLILLDLMMPIMDGYEFRAEQMKNPRLKDIPVAILSADGQVEKKAESLGITHSLKKPVDLNDLINLIEELA